MWKVLAVVHLHSEGQMSAPEGIKHKTASDAVVMRLSRARLCASVSFHVGQPSGTEKLSPEILDTLAGYICILCATCVNNIDKWIITRIAVFMLLSFVSRRKKFTEIV